MRMATSFAWRRVPVLAKTAASWVRAVGILISSEVAISSKVSPRVMPCARRASAGVKSKTTRSVSSCGTGKS